MGKGPNKNWQPPLLRGEKLRLWAHATAEMAVVTKVDAARTAKAALELGREIYDGAQQAIYASPNQNDHACHAGCPGCCHSLISVTPLETFVIAAWLREKMSTSEVAVIRQRAEETADKSKTMNNAEYAKSMLWCPLLDSQLMCSIYPARPLGCRAWNSLSLEACHDCYFANHPDKTISLDDYTYEIGQGVRSGLRSGMESIGLDGSSYELNSVLIVALDRPDAVECWARGEDVFEHCHKV